MGKRTDGNRGGGPRGTPPIEDLKLPPDKELETIWKAFEEEFTALGRAIELELNGDSKSTGRPIEMTVASVARMVLLIRRFVPAPVAAAVADIPPATFYRWLKDGARKGGRPTNKWFRQIVKKAVAECEMTGVLNMYSHSSTSAAAQQWLLEKSFPKRWGRNVGGPEEPAAAIADVPGYREMVTGFTAVLVEFVPSDKLGAAVEAMRKAMETANSAAKTPTA